MTTFKYKYNALNLSSVYIIVNNELAASGGEVVSPIFEIYILTDTCGPMLPK